MDRPYLYSRYWRGNKDEIIPVASIDESEDYEVDITEIYFDKTTKGFLLVTASGCSCWDGEYDEERYVSFEALKSALLDDGPKRRYNPTWSGGQDLLNQVEAWQKTGAAV